MFRSCFWQIAIGTAHWVAEAATKENTVFDYDARGRLIAEGTAAGAFRREYLYLSDIPIAVVVVP